MLTCLICLDFSCRSELVAAKRNEAVVAAADSPVKNIELVLASSPVDSNNNSSNSTDVDANVSTTTAHQSDAEATTDTGGSNSNSAVEEGPDTITVRYVLISSAIRRL